jgi:nucleoside 2-deoxyribosyltransferase
MAMPFGDKGLDLAFTDCFRLAAKDAGFELTRLDDHAPAGLIDNRLRVEILRTRFIIADLSNANAGAYWEAGFAEGLGKPVIYTCRRDHFDVHRTHFDTNHHLTIVWEPTDLADARQRLADTIRATLPGEAQLSIDAP